MRIWEKSKTFDNHELYEIYIYKYKLSLYRDSEKTYNIRIQHITKRTTHTIWQQSIPAENAWNAQDKAYEILQNILNKQKTELSKSLKALNTAIKERQQL